MHREAALLFKSMFQVMSFLQAQETLMMAAQDTMAGSEATALTLLLQM